MYICSSYCWLPDLRLPQNKLCLKITVLHQTLLMALGRRPARFHSPNSMQSGTKSITPVKLHLVRAAAARVYINEDKPGDSFVVSNREANKAAAAAAGINFENAEEADPDYGVKLLAAVAIEMAKGSKNEDPIHAGKKRN